MADYKIIGIVTAGINAGDASNDQVRSPFARVTMMPGGLSIGCRCLRCDYGVKIAIADDLSTFVSINGGNIWSNKIPNDDEYYGWPKSFLACSFDSFTLRSQQGTSDGFILNTGGKDYTRTYSNAYQYDEGTQIAGTTVFYSNFGLYTPKGGGAAYTVVGWYDPLVDPSSGYSRSFPSANSSVAKDVEFSGTAGEFRSYMANLGYWYVGKLDEAGWATDETSKTAYLYFSGIALFNSSGTTDSGPASAYRVEITALREFLKYYPWQRRIDGKWYSLNRNGGNQTATGLFKRASSAWQPETNEHDETSADNHGYMRASGAWVRSEKTGEGA